MSPFLLFVLIPLSCGRDPTASDDGTESAIVLGSELDDVDLYRPIVEMYTSAIKFS